MTLAEDILDAVVETYAPREADFEQWDLDALKREVERVFAVDAGALDFSDRTADEIRDALWDDDRRSRTRRRRSWSAARCSSASSATSCCRSSTRSGRTTSTASTT